MLLIIAPNWKEEKCLQTGEWTHQLWTSHTMEHKKIVKANELYLHKTTRLNFKPIVGLKKKTILRRLHVVWHHFYKGIKQVNLKISSLEIEPCEVKLFRNSKGMINSAFRQLLPLWEIGYRQRYVGVLVWDEHVHIFNIINDVLGSSIG